MNSPNAVESHDRRRLLVAHPEVRGLAGRNEWSALLVAVLVPLPLGAFLLAATSVAGEPGPDWETPAVETAHTSLEGVPPARRKSAPDPLFPARGEFAASFASGLPLLGIGEVAYGFGDRFSVGVVGAATPDIGDMRGTIAIGLRPRGILLASGAWRATLVVPILFYPQVKGFGDREPWFLIRPTLTVDYEFDSGLRLNGGMGLIAAACAESILSLGRESTMEGGLWNTFNIGASLPLAAQTSLFVEASLVMHGVVLARDWIGVVPVIALAGITTSF